MAVLPLQLARVSNALRMNLAQRTITRTQQSLTEVQNELATGKRITVPSDHPADAALAMQLRKTLDQRQAYASAINYGSMHLGAVDSALGDLIDLVRQAQTIASANVGSDVTAEARKAAAAVVESLYSQAINLGNRRFQGTYLFAGDKGAEPPFRPELGGVRFVGSDRTLENRFDESTVLSFMVDANQVFGAMSTRVRGSADLAPGITASTRLADLGGAGGKGVRPGTIQLSNGVTTVAVDLSGADTIGDVIDAINAAGVGSITARVSDDLMGLTLESGAAEDIRVSDIGGGTTAADLGIRMPGGTGAGVDLVGENVHARLTFLTALSSLRGGLDIDRSGLVITNGPQSQAIDFASAVTVEDLLNRINGSGMGVLARINSAGTGIDIINSVQGIAMRIAENGGSTAAQLGVRSFGPQTPLGELNGGAGVRTVSGDDIRITRRDGTSFTVDLTGLATVQDVIDAINAADAGGGVTASFSATDNGIVLTDSTGGAGALGVAAVNFSPAAADLGLDVVASGATLQGRDVNAVEANGLLAHLSKLRDALLTSDQRRITTASEGLESDLSRLTQVRGQVGARIQDMESRLNRLQEQDLATRTLLSSLEDTDYADAITRFQTLQTALQANLQTTGRLLNLSLLDFLG